MKQRKKRGQVAIFMVVGIVLFLIFGFLMFLRMNLTKSKIGGEAEKFSITESELIPVKFYIENLIRTEFLKSLKELGEGGGRISGDPPVLITAGGPGEYPDEPFQNQVSRGNRVGISSTHAGSVTISVEPGINIDENLRTDLLQKLNNFLIPTDGSSSPLNSQFQGKFTFDIQPISGVSVSLNEGDITVNLKIPIAATRAGEDKVFGKLEDFGVTIDFPFKTWLMGTIVQLIQQDVQDLSFNPEDTVTVQRGQDGFDTITVRHPTFTIDGEPFEFIFRRANRAPDANTVFLTRDSENGRDQEIGHNGEIQAQDDNHPLTYSDGATLTIHCPNYQTCGRRSCDDVIYADPDEDDRFSGTGEGSELIYRFSSDGPRLNKLSEDLVPIPGSTQCGAIAGGKSYYNVVPNQPLKSETGGGNWHDGTAANDGMALLSDCGVQVFNLLYLNIERKNVCDSLSVEISDGQNLKDVKPFNKVVQCNQQDEQYCGSDGCWDIGAECDVTEVCLTCNQVYGTTASCGTDSTPTGESCCRNVQIYKNVVDESGNCVATDININSRSSDCDGKQLTAVYGGDCPPDEGGDCTPLSCSSNEFWCQAECQCKLIVGSSCG